MSTAGTTLASRNTRACSSGMGLFVRSAVLFDRPTKLEAAEQGLRNWIAMFDQGVMSHVPDHKKEQVLRKVEDKTRCILFADGHWFADYRRLRIVAHKD